MNPVGVDLFTALPDAAETKMPASAGQEASEGDFLNEFLSMLFGESKADVQPAQLLELDSNKEHESIPLDEDQEMVDSTSKGQELFASEVEGKNSEHGVSVELEPSKFLEEPESNWAAPVTILKIEKSESPKEGVSRNPEEGVSKNPDEVSRSLEEGERNHSSQQGALSSVARRGEGVDLNSLPVAAPLRDAGETESSQVGTGKTAPSPQIQMSEPFVSTPSVEPRLNVESQTAEPSTNASTAEPSTQPGSAELPLENVELGNAKTLKKPISSSMRDHLTSFAPVPVTERHGPSQDGRVARLEINEAGVGMKIPVRATDLGTTADGQQNGNRDNSGTGNATQEEQLLRRLEASRTAGRIETAERPQPGSEPVDPIKVGSEKNFHEIGKAASSEARQFPEILISARPETNPLSGSEKLTLNEPLAAKELLVSQTAQNFDRIVDQIVKQISLQQKGETFQLGVRLKPEFLGEIRIETIMEADRTIRAVIHAEDPSVKALLEGKVAGLWGKFDEAGIHVDKVEVQTLLTDAGSGNDSSRDRQSLGHPSNGKGSREAATELSEQVEEASEKDIDDGHLHVFI